MSNKGITHPVLDAQMGRPLLYMLAVVMEELYAGAFDKTSIKLLDKMFETFDKLDRIVVPDANDWQRAGKVIAQLGGKYGFEDIFLARITNDALIALSARRIGAFVVTHNIKDFQRIREFVDFKLYGSS